MIKKKWIIPILLPIQILLIKWAKSNTNWVETNYSQTYYPKISNSLRTIFGWIDISVGDLIYIIVVINLLAFLWKKVRLKKVSWLEAFRKITAWSSIGYFLFHALWGLNYYRKPLHKILNIEHKYSTESLEKVTYQLLETSNQLHEQLQPVDSLPVKMPYAYTEAFNRTEEAYSELKKVFPNLDYSKKSLKPSLISTALSYMGFGGYINPFTNEAQVNRHIVKYKLPTTSCHEEAHQLGFAKENEANFIGALACMHSKDPYFNYSGYSFALRYCIHELYLQDEQKGLCALEEVRPGIKANYKQIKDFWDAHENPLEPLFKNFYNQFLKANNQLGGLRSYNYMVALVVNYFGEDSK